MLAHILEPDLVYTDDCERQDSDTVISFDVQLIARAGKKKRTLIVDAEKRTLTRYNPAKVRNVAKKAYCTARELISCALCVVVVGEWLRPGPHQVCLLG